MTTTYPPKHSSDVSLGQVSRAAFAVTVAIGVCILAFGWLSSGLDFAVNWEGGSLLRLKWFAVAFLAIIGVCALMGSKRRISALMTAFTLWLMVAFGVGPLVAVGLIGLAGLALGDLAFGRFWRESLGLLTAALLSLCVGLALLMYVIGFTAHFPINFPAFHAVLLGAPILLARTRLRLYFDGTICWLPMCETIDWREFAALAALLFLLALQSVYAALPEQYHHALALHLMVSTTMATHGQWNFDGVWSIGSMMPQGANWIFAIGYSLAGESGAKLVNFSLLGVIAMLLGSTVGRTHGRLVGVVTVILFVSMPLTFIETASLYAENALTIFFVAVTVLLMRSCETLSRSNTVAIAILLGGAALVKLHTAFFILPCALLLAFLLFRRHSVSHSIGTLLLAACVGILIGMQPYAYAYWATGNPIFPFFNAVFKSPFFDTTANFSDGRFSGLFTWHLLYDWTFASSRFLEANNGALGFTLITLLLPGFTGAIAARDRPVLLATFLGLGYAIGVASATQYLRYFYPVVPLLMMTCAASLHYFSDANAVGRIRGSAIAVVVAATALVSLNIAFVPTAGWILQSFQVDSVIDPRERVRFMSKQVPQRDLIEIVNALAGPEANVLVVGQAVGAGFAGKPFFLNWYNTTLLRTVSAARTPEEVGRVLNRNRIGYAMVQPDDPWAVYPLTEFLARFGRLIAKRGSVVLYDVQSDAGFVEELLSNGDFHGGMTGWNLSSGTATLENDQLTLSPKQSIVQAIPASPTGLFLYSVEINCGNDPSYFQLQVNWVNAAGAYAGVAIQPHYCLKPGLLEISEKFPAPEGTVSAQVYFNVPGEIPVSLKRISIKQQ
jgi:hypothetical protein